jgi:hypothetical protein
MVNLDELVKVGGEDLDRSVYTRTVEQAYRIIVELLPEEHGAVLDLGGVVLISYSFTKRMLGAIKAKNREPHKHSLNVCLEEPATLSAVVPRSGLDVAPIGEVKQSSTLRYTWAACLRGVGLKPGVNEQARRVLGLQDPRNSWARSSMIERWW